MNVLVAADLPPGWRIAWFAMFTICAVICFAGFSLVAELVLDELRPWIAKLRTRALREQQQQRNAERATLDLAARIAGKGER